MKVNSEKFWRLTRPILERFAARIGEANPSLRRGIAGGETKALFLSANLSITKHGYGDEIAVSVGAKYSGDRISVRSDICHEANVLAIGPTLTFDLAALEGDSDPAIDEWLVSFETFLESEENAVLLAADDLS